MITELTLRQRKANDNSHSMEIQHTAGTVMWPNEEKTNTNKIFYFSIIPYKTFLFREIDR